MPSLILSPLSVGIKHAINFSMKNLFVILVFLFSSALYADNSITPAKSAVVLIDMQPYFVTRYGFDKNQTNLNKVSAAIAEQINVINEAKKKNLPIIIVEYALIGPLNNLGSTDSRLMQAVEGYYNYEVIKKSTDDVFSEQNYWRSDIKFFLNMRNVNHLVIVGANGSQCVQSSVRGALDSGYNVTTYTKGIADFQNESFVYPYSSLNTKWYNLKCSTCSHNQVTQLEELSTWMSQ